ncbi:transglutaminase family protein [Pseudorhodobacter sp. W20_MBD10_FR17]|uniref:transglutaminase-like domain-containing protein n=1 Tax=Pseudorhodobacter sp. W20_MBD10_FR17 TaxID=3240266 RepID=UPI003F969AA4
MILNVNVHLNYAIQNPTDVLLQLSVPDQPDQRVLEQNISYGDDVQVSTLPAEGGVGERILMNINHDLNCTYSARIDVNRPIIDIADLAATPPHKLPSDVIRYLMPSRFCQSDELQNYVAADFGNSMGGQRIAQLRDWIFERYRYVPGSSNGHTTAIDTFVQRQGVCRDFAHVLIALSRASAIPARFVSVYAPYVTPQDFHAVAEVYLDGAWHLVDPTGMAASNQMARIGVGLDAAEVPFMASFGPAMMQYQSVRVWIEG